MNERYIARVLAGGEQSRFTRWLIYSRVGAGLGAGISLLLGELSVRRAPPDELLLVTPDRAADYVRALRGDRAAQLVLQRYSKTSIRVCEVSPSTGELSGELSIYIKGDSLVSRGEFEPLEGFDFCEMLEAFDANSAIVHSPHGYLFQKNSGKLARFFVRAERLLTNSDAAEILALAAMARATADDFDCKKIRRIYIDTPGIMAVAYAVRSFLRDEGFNGVEIINFRSHNGLDDLERGLLHDSLVLISASTSDDMLGKIEGFASRQRASCRVVTLVGGALSAKRPLLRLSSPSASEVAPTSLGDSRVLRLEGDSFFPVFDDMGSRVVLCERHWRAGGNASVSGEVEALVQTGIFELHREVGVVRDLYVDGGRLSRLEKYRQWLKDWVIDRIPKSTSTIIYQESDGSRETAEFIKAKSGSSCNLLSATELFLGAEKISGAVLVVANVISSGSQLINISRHLRDRHESRVRHYAIGVALPKSATDFRLMRANLEASGREIPKYDVSVFRNFPVGHASTEWWEREAKVLSALQVPVEVERRISLLRRGSGGGFLPFVDELFQPLTLSDEFAPWGGRRLGGAANNAELYLTVRCILQVARESGELPLSLSLSSHVLCRPVLAPSNFARFSDPVIQAAILAASEDRDFDYSASLSDSDEYLRLLEDQLQATSRISGGGAYSMLLALVMGKVKLHPEVLPVKRLRVGDDRKVLAALISFLQEGRVG